MLAMLVTLEVSKLSGWLNADARCRESNGGRTVRGEVRAGRRVAAGVRGASGVHGPTLSVECRKEGIRRWARFGPGGGRRRATAVHVACRGELDCRFGAADGEERT